MEFPDIVISARNAILTDLQPSMGDKLSVYRNLPKNQQNIMVGIPLPSSSFDRISKG